MNRNRLYHLGIGSNVGTPANNLAAAIAALATAGVTPARLSPIYLTEPVGYADQPDFLNCVLAARASFDPHDLLGLIHDIEAMLGRSRPFPNAPRTIDIDILLCEDTITDTTDVTIPHPRMRSRQFVLIPLHDIAPDLTMPDGTPLGGLVQRDADGIRCIGRLGHIVRRPQEGDDVRRHGQC